MLGEGLDAVYWKAHFYLHRQGYIPRRLSSVQCWHRDKSIFITALSPNFAESEDQEVYIKRSKQCVILASMSACISHTKCGRLMKLRRTAASTSERRYRNRWFFSLFVFSHCLLCLCVSPCSQRFLMSIYIYIYMASDNITRTVLTL